MSEEAKWQDLSIELALNAKKNLDSKDDEITTLRQQLAESEARAAELSNLCERLQHCAQGFYVDQGDYGHMEAIMKDYHWIMRASKPWRDSYMKRVQAEAVEKFGQEIGVFDPEYDDQEYVEVPRREVKRYAERLRQQADEAERAGGEK